MNPKIVYPIPPRQEEKYRVVRNIMRIVFIVLALISLITNYFVGGKAWSLIVVWALIALWRLIFSLELVEFSIFAHATKAIFYVLVLLWLIDHFLIPGWAYIAMPIFAFLSLLVMAIIFYATYSKKEKHLLPILWLGLYAVVLLPYSFKDGKIYWLTFSFTLASLVILLVLLITNFKSYLHEAKIRFRAKELEE